MLKKLVISELKMFFRNRQLLFWTFFLPVFVITLLGLLFSQPIQQYGYRLGVVDYDHSGITENSTKQLSNVSSLSVVEYSDLNGGLNAIRHGDVDLVVVFLNGTGSIVQDHLNGKNTSKTATVELYYLDSDRVKIDIAMNTVYRIVDELNLRIHSTPISVKVDENALSLSGTGRQLRYIDYFVPGIISLCIMNVGIYTTISLISSMKEKHILRRLSITPLSRPTFIISLFITRLFIALICAGLILAIAVFAFDIKIVGSIWAILVIVIMGTTVFILLGLAISGYAKSSSSAEMIANAMWLPMIFIANAFIPLEFLPPAVGTASRMIPLTYVTEPIRSVFFFNVGLSDISMALGTLSLWAGLFFLLAIALFKWE